jgi:signal transduction histidine kinase
LGCFRLKELNKAWGAFALNRVRQDKRQRRRIDVADLVRSLLIELRPVFEASNIQLLEDIRDVKGKTFAMDVESIVLNLLTNSYYFTKLTKRSRVIKIKLHGKMLDNQPGMELTVSDTGPGVKPGIREQIWRPLFSTKVDRQGRSIGTGLGLSIVDSIVRDLYGEKSVSSDSELHGACFRVWLRLG